jgi:CheY-like chemotaxis protein
MPISLLVYDDTASIGRLVVRFAGLMGMDATAVTDAESFARRLRADRPPLIVLDLELGDTDAIEQLRVAAELRFTGSIVLMSGHNGEALAEARALGQSLGLKIVGVLQKPLRVADFERMVGRFRPARRLPDEATSVSVRP